ncbi:MAG: response regulator, partial [Spirochaetales bacterium]|nr:response regulator [Spirochaetales bacterium]
NLLINQSREYYNAALSRTVKNFEKNASDLTKVVRNLWQTTGFAEAQRMKITDIQSELRIMRQLNDIKNNLDEKNIFNQMFLSDYGDIAVVHLHEKSAITGQNRVDYLSDEAFLVNVPILQEQMYYSGIDSVRESLVLNVVDSGIVVGRNTEHINVFFVPIFRQKEIDRLVMILTKQTFWNDMFDSEMRDDSHLLYVTDKYDKVLWTNDHHYTDDAHSILSNIDIHRIMHRLKNKKTTEHQKSFGRIKYRGTHYMVFSESDLSGEAGFIMLVPISRVTYSVRAYVQASILMLMLLLLLTLLSSLISGRVFAKPIERHNDTLQNENLYFMNLAHETKTPLTLIYNYLDQYIADHGSSHELEIIRSNMEKINNNMLHFLDIGKIERGQGTVSENAVTNITAYLQEKADLYKITADKKHIAVTMSLQQNVFVHADVFSLDRILDNIFEDAVKFTGEGGKIDISLTTEAYMAVIHIQDNGIGIDEKFLRHMFKPYHQLGGRRNEAGTGLGLYIIKKIIDSLGGSITANSVKGVGTEFIIHLPSTSDQTSYSAENDVIIHHTSHNESSEIIIADSQSVSSDRFILVVEDNDDLRRYLTGVLGRYYHVFEADNGESALQQLDNIPKPDLIISDVMMDQMNGFDFYEHLRQRPERQDITFIFLSALAALPEKLRGLEIGAIDYIQKPFVIDELLAKIKSVLDLNELKATLSEKDKYASLGILLSGISHEIFNPLAGIYGPLENLERIAAKSNNMTEEEKHKFEVFTDNIWTNIRRIESIIKSLKSLHYNKDMEIEDVNLGQTADTVINILMTKVKNRQISLINSIDSDCVIRTSPGGMTQIMMNLISNAIDAIPDEKTDGRVEVSIVKENDRLELLISDNGSGIPSEKVGTIFNAFYSSKESGKGMGLGLYIVKNLVMKLNFDIKVESEIGKGTTFRVKIR